MFFGGVTIAKRSCPSREASFDRQEWYRWRACPAGPDMARHVAWKCAGFCQLDVSVTEASLQEVRSIDLPHAELGWFSTTNMGFHRSTWMPLAVSTHPSTATMASKTRTWDEQLRLLACSRWPCRPCLVPTPASILRSV